MQHMNTDLKHWHILLFVGFCDLNLISIINIEHNNEMNLSDAIFPPLLKNQDEMCSFSGDSPNNSSIT